MKTILVNVSNDHDYKIGKLLVEGAYLCDTLELGGVSELPNGDYKLRLVIEAVTNNKVVAIDSDNQSFIAVILSDNHYYDKSIKMRANNNNITVGTILNGVNMVMNKFALDHFIKLIEASAQRNESILLSVISAGDNFNWK